MSHREPSSLEKLIAACDAEIKAGNVAAAAKQLAQLNLAKVPRALRLSIATLCRRTDLITKALRLLTPVVRPEDEAVSQPATAEELTEYAALLQRCGAVGEAISILSSIDKQAVPEAHLIQAFCYFNTWDYRKAVPCLEAYVECESRSYQNLVGRVNLAAAYLTTGELDKTIALLVGNIEIAKKDRLGRLHANCLELLAQAHIRGGRLDDAETALSRAKELMGGSQTIDSLYVRKWKSILAALRDRSAETLVDFRALALAQRDPESVREADFYRIKVDHRQDILDHLYFGTPFPAYRKRIVEELGKAPSGNSYVHGVKGSRCFDVTSARMLDGSLELPKGGKIHLVLANLLEDLYRPKRLGELFAALFPGEYFDIFTSPSRVHQLLHRTRHWAEENGLMMGIGSDDGFYSLSIVGELSFLLRLEPMVQSRQEAKIEQLRAKLGSSQSFDRNRVMQVLGVSAATASRILTTAVEAGALEKFGSSTATTYYFPDRPGTELP